MKDYKICYDVLSKIYKDKAYSNLELNKILKDCANPQFVTKLVYGVLEKNTSLDYYIGFLCDKKPQNSIIILLKMAMYCIQYMDSMPNYAVVDKTVDLCQEVGKRQLKGFVNSVLKKFCQGKIPMPSDVKENLSIQASVPLWLIKEYCKQYGLEKTKEFVLAPDFSKEHIRPNTRQISYESLKKLLIDSKILFEESNFGGFFVDNNKKIGSMFASGLVTFQSPTSMICVKALEIKDNDKVLDLCSAPGGKSVYAQELATNVKVVACDVHAHRVELIQSYCKRMKAVNIKIEQRDATVFDATLEKSFDKVLCDAPCSGFGVARKKPDIYLDATLKGVEDLAVIQYKILENASKYVKDSGLLVYSTCTLLRQENANIVGRFVKENKQWKIINSQQYFPDGKGIDGFYIAQLQKVEK